MNKKPGRNDPCPCGSGKKYKKCCLGKDREIQALESVECLEDARETSGPESGAVFSCSRNLAVAASKATPSGKDDGIYNSLEDVFESIRKTGFIPTIESEDEGTVDDIEEFCVSPSVTVALVCKHAYSEEARTYELRNDGKYEWIESGFNLPCPHCIENMPPFEMTEEEIIDLYKELTEFKELSISQDC